MNRPDGDTRPPLDDVQPSLEPQYPRRDFLAIVGGGTAATALLAACGGEAQTPPLVRRNRVTAASEYAPIYPESGVERILDMGKAHAKAVDNAVNRFVRKSLLEKYKMYYRPPDLGFVVDSTGGSNVFHINSEGLLAGASSRVPAVYFTFMTAGSFSDPFTMPHVEITADNRLTVKTDSQKQPSPPVERVLTEVNFPIFNGTADPKKITKDDFISLAVSLFNTPPEYNWQNANLEEVSGQKTWRITWTGDDGQPVRIVETPGMATLAWGPTIK